MTTTLQLQSKIAASVADTAARGDADVKAAADRAWLLGVYAASVPRAIEAIVEWAAKYVKLYGEDGIEYDPHKSPWSVHPLELCADPSVASLTYVKPIQSGGTTVGEIAILYRIVTGIGQILYNWPTDDKAKDRWDKYTGRRIRACAPVRRLIPSEGSDRFKAVNCQIIFPAVGFTQQGVTAETNLDSDSIGFIVNEEVHAWPAGAIMKAKGRQTRVAFPKFINISNAGRVKTQLHEEYKSGTMQELEVKCPGCQQWHIMRIRWDDRRPDLGGLRYDTEGCKYGDDQFNYNKLISTIRYQMPCGYIVPYDVTHRRKLCALDNIRYSEPTNPGALLKNRSLKHSAVVCHNIDWLDLIQKKHAAWRQRAADNFESWSKWIMECECEFYDPENLPFQGQLVINSGVTKNREGLAGRAGRLAFADWQQGFKHLGQLIHYWLVIEDVMPDLNSQVVFEGKVESESELLAILEEHQVPAGATAIDASKNTKHILQFCYQNGFNATMSNASHVGSFLHKADGVRRFYSEGKPIHSELNVQAKYEYRPTRDGWVPDPDEPLVISLNKGGMLANHFFIREFKARVIANAAEENPPRIPGPDEYFERTIPGDVSEEFRAQYESWARVGRDEKKKTGDIASPSAEAFRQIRQSDHMLICLANIDMFKDWSGLLGDALGQLGIKTTTELEK